MSTGQWYRIEYRGIHAENRDKWYPRGECYVLRSDAEDMLKRIQKLNPNQEYRITPFDA